MATHFCGASAQIGLLELARTRVSGHHGQTGASVDVGVTLAGSSDENIGLISGMSASSLTALRHFASSADGPLTGKVSSLFSAE
jgi:hypothetical protein